MPNSPSTSGLRTPAAAATWLLIHCLENLSCAAAPLSCSMQPGNPPYSTRSSSTCRQPSSKVDGLCCALGLEPACALTYATVGFLQTSRRKASPGVPGCGNTCVCAAAAGARLEPLVGPEVEAGEVYVPPARVPCPVAARAQRVKGVVLDQLCSRKVQPVSSTNTGEIWYRLWIENVQDLLCAKNPRPVTTCSVQLQKGGAI